MEAREGGRTSVGAAALQFRARSREGDLLFLLLLLLGREGVEKLLSPDALGLIPISSLTFPSCVRDGKPVAALAPATVVGYWW